MTAQFTLEAMGETQASHLAVAANPALFLHTGWRSAGTWIWSSLRADARVMAFYEPLNEQLASLNTARIARLRPAHWHSGHGGAEPYYSEFRDLLHRGRGVQGYQERFAADRFFLDEEASDPALKAYIAHLLRRAHDAGRVPVLKFCRSLGRVSWMQRHFPDALHAVVLRDPLAQWRSARHQVSQFGNSYFLAGPLLILARNASHPLAAAAIDRLGVRLPGLSANGSLALDQEICWRHLERASWSERYRAFLAFWTAGAIAALEGSKGHAGLTLIDSDALLVSREHRDDVETTLLARLGIPLCLASHNARAPGAAAGFQDDEPVDQDSIARAHASALALLKNYGSALSEAAFATIMGKLTASPAITKPSRSALIHQALRAAGGGPARGRARPASWSQSLYCAGIRLSMAWRRLRRRTRLLLTT